jgi:ATP-dependent Lon protease
MELPDAVPVMTLPSATLFPQALLPLYIFEPRYRQMLADMLRTDRMFSVAMQQPGKQRELPCPVAGLGLIRVSVAHQDGTSHLILQGLSRVQLVKTVQVKPYRIASIRPLLTPPRSGNTIQTLVSKVHALVEERLSIAASPLPFSAFQNSAAFSTGKGQAGKGPTSSKQILDYLGSLKEPDQLADYVSCALLPDAVERQEILATVELESRLRSLVNFLMAEICRARLNSGK